MKRSHVEDLRGAGRLAVAATRSVTDLVEAMHRSIASGPGGLLDPLHPVLAGPVYATIRGVTSVVGAGLDLALRQLAPLLGESVPGPERDAILAALNGVLGDYLAETGNPLAVAMRLRAQGQPRPRLLVLAHGSSMGDLGWRRRGFDLGEALAPALGATAVYLRYNSGLHVSTNGRLFAGELERLVASWPVPVEEITIVAHSMGGLVARAACHVAEQGGLAWRGRLRQLSMLGSPHHGAPLERAGNWVDALLAIHPHSAPLGRLGRLRSAGVTDLRHGYVLDEHWAGRDRFARGRDDRTPLPLPAGVVCHAVAATRSASAAGRPRGDGLVPVDSALGRHPRPELTLAFAAEHQLVVPRAGHLDLLDHPDVLAQLLGWLR